MFGSDDFMQILLIFLILTYLITKINHQNMKMVQIRSNKINILFALVLQAVSG